MSDKTEKPTAKKIRDARKKGNVAKSKEVVNVVTFLGIIFVFSILSDFIIRQLEELISMFLTMDISNSLNEDIENKKIFVHLIKGMYDED